MPQSMNQFNQHVANVHLDPSMTINQDVTNYQQVNATQNNQFVNQDTGPMVAQMAEARHGEIIAGLQSQSEAMRREIQMNAEQRVNTMKSEREAEMKYQSAMNTISEQERQIRELRAMVEQMMQSQQQPPAQPAPAPVPPVQQAPATPLTIPTIPLAASPPGLSNASSHSWTKVGSDPCGKDGSVPAGAVDDAATGDGWPGDDGDCGNDKDKKKKKKKKDRSRRRRRDPSSSPSSSSSSTSTASDESFRRKLLKHLGNSSDPTAERVRVKEGDRIQIPRLPKPEQYRNWRIKVRDAVVATSDQLEKAFEWIEATWIPGQTVEVLRDSGMFVHLDARLASALTNILEGDLAWQVDIFKEQEAKEKRYARGRQILLMVYKHFSTNIKHGAIYDFEDLLSVQLINEDLKNFMTRWDTVIAGMGNEQNEKTLEALFHRQIRKFRPLSHDLNEYERAEEGTEKHSYKFLIDASRNYLERKRLVHMRDAMSSNTTGRGRTPSNNPAVPGAPRVYWVKFQTGQCTYGSDFQPPSRCRNPWRSKTEARRSEAPRPKRRRSTSKRSGRTWSTWRRKPRVFVFFLAHRWAVLPAPVFFLQGFEGTLFWLVQSSDCRFEHVKAPKGKEGKKGGSRSQTPRKYRLQSPPGSKPQVCKFFKANRGERGKDCPWQHPATSKAALAPKSRQEY